MCDQKREKIIGFMSGYKNAVDEAQRITDENFDCDFVMLSVSNTVDDLNDSPIPTDANNLYDEATEELYWGFNAICVHQIFPKESSNFLIPVNSARDIWVRSSQSKNSVSRIAFSCFRYKTDED